MKETIKVIVKRPDEAVGHFAVVKNTLKGLQDAVNGYIEVVPLGESALMIINEEGKLLSMPANFMYAGWDIIAGTALIVRSDSEDFDDCPITLDSWMQMLVSWGN